MRRNLGHLNLASLLPVIEVRPQHKNSFIFVPIREHVNFRLMEYAVTQVMNYLDIYKI